MRSSSASGGSASGDVGLPIGARSILFVVGKGGVGKTTVAGALGLALAERGERVLLVSTDPAHSLGDLFETPIGPTETRIWTAPSRTGSLDAMELDAETETEQYLEGVRDAMRTFVRPALFSEIERQIALTRHAPGAAEAALLDRVAALMATGPEKWDRVIFDTAPTGHTLRLLALPELMAAWTDGLLRQRERSDQLSRILNETPLGANASSGKKAMSDPSALSASKPVLEGDDLGMLDDRDAGPTDPRLRRLRERLLERRRRFGEARNRLLDPTRVGFLLVLIPERLPILETASALQALGEHGVPVLGLVVNRILPPEASGAFLEARRAQEHPYLAEIETRFASHPRIRVPLEASDVSGLDRLRALGARLLTG
jgi:arsenite/tail-anchored protein-transporting ATPase